MVRAWVRHKMPGRCLALTLLVGVCAALAAAQQPPKPHASPAPRLIILPTKVVAGAQATLAVLDSQGRLLPNVAVELSGGQKVTTDVTGRAMFKAPDQPGTTGCKSLRPGNHRVHDCGGFRGFRPAWRASRAPLEGST